MNNQANTRKNNKKKGASTMATFGILALLAIASVAYVDHSTQTLRLARNDTEEITTTHLCEAGIQAVLRDLWRPFKVDQLFIDMDDRCFGATALNPKIPISGEIDGVGRFAAGVISMMSDVGDPYTRVVHVRSVGWIDYNDNGVMDEGEPRKVVDVVARFELTRSAVFDYTYFVNNYGWMNGFQPTWLIVNGDMRANGNFDFLNGSPTINGSVVAANNEKLVPGAPGLINMAPLKWTDANYKTQSNNASTPHRDRWRQPYDPAIHGAIGSAEFNKWRDLVFFSEAQVENNRIFGAAMMDASGVQGWVRTAVSQSPTYNMLDQTPTEEVVMPDLGDLNYYLDLSQNYYNTKEFYGDGTPNPNYGEEAYVEVWNSSTSSYERLSTDGVINGSAVLVGTSTHPIRVHGPVTVTQDVVIKGFIEGQGTLYTGRNTHVVGSIRYKNGPDFRGTNMETIENNNEKKDFLGLAARGSVMMGNSTTFSNPYPLAYMTPPFTKGRYDDDGNFIPPFDAMQFDETGRRRYQSVVPDSVVNSIAEGVNQIDAIIYTNFVGGGNVGTSGGGMTLNGTIIAKDEAIVTWSLPIRMNYDNRIREREATKNPLIDLQLPRSPAMLRSTWQDRGLKRG